MEKKILQTVDGKVDEVVVTTEKSEESKSKKNKNKKSKNKKWMLHYFGIETS